MTPSFSTFLSFLVVTSFGWCSWAGDATQTFSDESTAYEIDLFVRHLMNCHPTPALTLAVVKDGRVVLAKGYGYTSANRTQPVDSRTKFAIGSLTKAFTATLIAKWIHEQDGNISVDTPIQSFYKEFRVTDDVRSSQATLRDLLSHRMGVPSYFVPLLVGFAGDLTRDKLAQKMAFMPDDNNAFRDKLIYNNFMYALAGHVLEVMSGGRTWEELTWEILLSPLNMTSTGFADQLTDFSNLALPCAFVNGSIVDISVDLFKAISPCGPAGSLYSNAEDMAKWMNFQLSEGIGPQGLRVIDPEVIKLTREPGMLLLQPDELILPTSPVSHVVKSYTLGWMTGYYRGYEQLYHTGGFVTYSSRLWLFPGVNAGVYVNVNGPQTRDEKNNLLESLMYFASDHLLGEQLWLQKDEVCKTLADLEPIPTTAASSQTTATIATTDTPPQFNGTMSPEIDIADEEDDAGEYDALVGNYTHQFFGTLEVSMHKPTKKPVFKYGRFGEMIAHKASSYAFLLHFDGPLSYMNAPGEGYLLTLSTDMNGAVDALFLTMDPKAELVRFDRVSQGTNKGIGSNYNIDMASTVFKCMAALLTAYSITSR